MLSYFTHEHTSTTTSFFSHLPIAKHGVALVLPDGSYRSNSGKCQQMVVRLWSNGG